MVCLVAEIGDSGDAWAARYAYRRVTVNPIVGKSTLWKNTRDIVAEPDCRNNPEDDAGWEKTF